MAGMGLARLIDRARKALRAPHGRARRRNAGGDGALVVAAANALDLREIELFRLAWRRWYDAAPNPALIERAFAGYMFQGEAPPWVRHFARDVLARARAGTLSDDDFGAAAERRTDAPVRHGRLYVAACAAAVALFLTVLMVAPGDPVNNPRSAALCRGGPGLAFVTAAARHFTGRRRPFECR